MDSTIFGSMSEVSIVAGRIAKISIGKPEVKGQLVYTTPEEELRNIAGKMVEKDLDEIPVMERKKLVGVLSMKQIVRRKNLPANTKVKTLMIAYPELHPWSNVFDLAEAIVDTGFRQLPVTEDGRLVGVADRTLLVSLVSTVREIGRVSVSSVMTPSVVALSEKEYLDKAFETMRSTGIRTIPIVDDAGRMTSILSISDLIALGLKSRSSQTFGEIVGNANPVEITVGSIAGKDYRSLSPSDSMEKAMKLMLNEKVRSLTVLSDGVPVGIVTKFDIAQMVTSLRIREAVYVQITGLTDEGILEEMYNAIQKSMNRIEKISRPVSLYMHVHTYSSEFSKVKYSLSAKLQTVDKLFVAKSIDWEPLKTVQDLLYKLESMVKEMKSMRVDARKHKKSARLEA